MHTLPETFSVLFSIRAFLIDILEKEVNGLRLFLNPILLPHEKEEMAGLDHYLRIEVTEGEINWEQPLDVSFRLWATVEFDPTTLWLQKTPYRIIQLLMNTKTDPGINMIALMDYDKLVGRAAIDAFYTQGTIPANLETIVQKRPPEVLYYLTRGMRTGLKLLPSNYAPNFDYDTVPMSASWTMTFKYFEPSHQKALRR